MDPVVGEDISTDEIRIHGRGKKVKDCRTPLIRHAYYQSVVEAVASTSG